MALADAVVAEVEFGLAAPSGPQIHPTAAVSPRAELADGVRIGPYAVVGPEVRIGPDTWVGAHAVIDGRTTIGARNRIFPFASVGAMPQDLKYRGEPSTLTIGDANIVREYVSLNPGTEGGGMETRRRQRLPLHGVLARRTRLPRWAIPSSSPTASRSPAT